MKRGGFRRGGGGGDDRTGDMFGDTVQQLYDDGTYPVGFWAWLRKNEHVYDEFVKLARRAKRRGAKCWSARGIIHVLRWRTGLREGDQNALKLNDHSTPGLARLAMEREKDLTGFFRTRKPPGAEEARRLDGSLYVDPE